MKNGEKTKLFRFWVFFDQFKTCFPFFTAECAEILHRVQQFIIYFVSPRFFVFLRNLTLFKIFREEFLVFFNVLILIKNGIILG